MAETSKMGPRGRTMIFALATAALLASQDPLAGPAAQKLSVAQYILINQIALMIATPFLLVETQARRDFVAILKSASAWKHLAALMAVGLIGLALYNLGLSRTHPVVISAILNLSPFWAALVARTIAGIAIPAGGPVFAASLISAFVGAMIVAYSQLSPESLAGGWWSIISQGSWWFALPVPVFTALSGSLIEIWFKDRSDSAAVAAALLTSALVMIPACAFYLWISGQGFAIDLRLAGLLATGAILSSAIGRLCYQHALRSAGNDNGFVTMFFLLSPALSGLYSWLLSTWVSALKFSPNPAYFVGLAVTAASLFYFVRHAMPSQSDDKEKESRAPA